MIVSRFLGVLCVVAACSDSAPKHGPGDPDPADPDPGGPPVCDAGMHIVNGVCVPDPPNNPPPRDTFASLCKAALDSHDQLERESMSDFVLQWAQLGISGCDNIGAHLETQATLAFTFEDPPRRDAEGMIRYRPWQIDNGVVKALSALPALGSLTLELMPRVNDLSPLANTATLKELQVVGCAATDFSFLAETDLETLSIRSQGIDSLVPLEHLASLVGLTLIETQTPDLTSLAKRGTLRSLVVTHNHVTDATPLENLIALHELVLDDNQIASIIPLRNLIALRTLSIRNNQITDLAPISHSIGLTSLMLRGNAIADLSAIRNFRQLKTLDVAGNPIASFEPISEISGLTSLNVNATGITSLNPIQANTNLEALFISRNPLRFGGLSLLPTMPALRTLAVESVVSQTPLDVTTLALLTQLTSLAISGDELDDLDVVASLPNLTALVANDNAITDVTPAGTLTKLTRLEIRKNGVTDLEPLAPLQALVTFDASDNAIDSEHCPVAPVAKSQVLSDFCRALQ
jgi:internalin A